MWMLAFALAAGSFAAIAWSRQQTNLCLTANIDKILELGNWNGFIPRHVSYVNIVGWLGLIASSVLAVLTLGGWGVIPVILLWLGLMALPSEILRVEAILSKRRRQKIEDAGKGLVEQADDVSPENDGSLKLE